MLKTILIIVFSSILYFIFVKPLRLLVNEHVILPILDFLFYNCDVSVPKSDHTDILIKSLNNNSKVLFRIPFNGFYIVPSILMVVENQIALFKKYTLIHLVIIFTPLLLFALGINSQEILTGDLFKMLVIFLSLIFTTLVITHKNDEGNKYEK